MMLGASASSFSLPLRSGLMGAVAVVVVAAAAAAAAAASRGPGDSQRAAGNRDDREVVVRYGDCHWPACRLACLLWPNDLPRSFACNRIDQ